MEGDRDTVELFSNFQDFSMNGNHHHPPPPALFSYPYHSNTASFSGSDPFGSDPYDPSASFSNGNHPYHSSTASYSTGNHQPNSSFWAVGDEPGFVPNHHHHNQLHNSSSSNLAPTMNGGNRYADNLLESEFSRLSLNHMSGQPATYVAPLPTPPPQLRDMDIQRMRIQSAARGQVGSLYMPQLDDFAYNLNEISYNMPILHNSLRNFNGYHQPQLQHFRSSSYDFGVGSSLNNSSRNNNFQYRSVSADRINNSLQADWRINGGRPSSRQRVSNFSSLKDLRGKIYAVSKDQHGCRFLQTKFEEGKPEEIQMIFMEVKDHICELMVDQFGNYLVQKFLAACNQEQITQLLLLVIGDEEKFMEICNDSHGTRSVQKLLEFLTTAEQRARVISVLRRITVPLTKNLNGHHVIQYCLKHFSREDNKLLLNVVADNCMDIALDKSGCCVIQQCVEHAVGEPRERIISEITSNAIILSEHPYGNYVVQYILGLKIRQATADIMAELSGNLVSLSMSKYGSNVIEKFLKYEPEDSQVIPIVEEIMYSPNFLRVLTDPFGNYVAQTALRASKGMVRNAMANMIMENYKNLHSHPHGKRVLASIKGHKIRV